MFWFQLNENGSDRNNTPSNISMGTTPVIDRAAVFVPMSRSAASQIIRFGDFEGDLSSGELRRSSGECAAKASK
jgi:hypothetical protein